MLQVTDKMNASEVTIRTLEEKLNQYSSSAASNDRTIGTLQNEIKVLRGDNEALVAAKV